MFGCDGSTDSISPNSQAAATFQLADARLSWSLQELAAACEASIQEPDSPEDGKAAYGRNNKAVFAVVADYLSSNRCDFKRLLSGFAKDRDRHEFDYVRNAVILCLIRKNDNKRLTELLAVNCPVERMWLTNSIEYLLVNSLRRQGVTLLCNAWSRSDSPENRQRIVAALRRSFQPLGVEAASDDNYVVEVQRWLHAEQDNYVLNYNYTLKYATMLPDPEQIPLLIPKNQTAAVPGTNPPPLEL